MKSVIAALVACSASPLWAAKLSANPLDDVIELLNDLQQKTIKEGETSHKVFEEFAHFCGERVDELTHEITTSKAEVEGLESNIAEQKATITKLITKTEDLAGDVASDDSSLKEATAVRDKEKTLFLSEEKELMETIDMLKRAILLLEKKASMLQLKNAGNLAQTLSVMVQASVIGTADADKLTAFVQSAQESSADDDDAAGAPAGAVYESKSGSIVSTLQDLLEKAESQLDKARTTETDAQNNFDMLEQSLRGEVKAAQKDMEYAKNGISAAEEEKSSSEGELAIASKHLATGEDAKHQLHNDCLSKATAFESETKSRDEELGVIQKAKQILKESIEGSFAQLSFAQVSKQGSSDAGPDFKVARFVRELGGQMGSTTLTQLAARMASTIRSANGGDPWQKIKAMLTINLAAIEGEIAHLADKDAHCKQELAETKEKKTDTKDEVEKLDTEGERMNSKADHLKDGVSEVEGELSDLTKTQAEMDRLRAEEKAKYGLSKEMIEKSLGGAQMAIKVLKEYYSQDGKDTSGAAGSIINILQNVESKLSAWLADETSDEERAASEYDEMTQENEIEKATDETDLDHKTGGIKNLKKRITEVSSDEEVEEEKLGAVVQYYTGLKDDCVANPGARQAKQNRLRKELDGLKEAMKIIQTEMVFLQTGSSHRLLRGILKHNAIAA